MEIFVVFIPHAIDLPMVDFGEKFTQKEKPQDLPFLQNMKK